MDRLDVFHAGDAGKGLSDQILCQWNRLLQNTAPSTYRTTSIPAMRVEAFSCRSISSMESSRLLFAFCDYSLTRSKLKVNTELPEMKKILKNGLP